MKIKKYVADSMPEVLKLVNDDLGPMAVVLNTRTIGKTGILGKKGQVEITAASDDGVKAAKKTRPAKKPETTRPAAATFPPAATTTPALSTPAPAAPR